MTTKTKTPTGYSVVMTATCAPFGGEPARHRVCVEPDDRVLVIDPVAGWFSACHRLNADECAALVRRAEAAR